MDVNKKNKKGETCLHILVKENPSVELVEFLLEKGGRVEEKTNKGKTCVDLACIPEKINSKLVSVMVKHGGNKLENLSKLFEETMKRGESSIQVARAFFIEQGADVNYRDAFYSLPIFAQQFKEDADLELINLLIENGANVNHDVWTWNIFEIALYNNFEVAKLLLKKGWNRLKIRDSIKWACKSSIVSLEMINFLMENGAELKESHPLSIAISNETCSLQVLQFVVENTVEGDLNHALYTLLSSERDEEEIRRANEYLFFKGAAQRNKRQTYLCACSSGLSFPLPSKMGK